MVVAGTLALLLPLVAPQSSEGPPEVVVEWIREHAEELDIDAPSPDAESLRALLPMFRDARLIALGEGTHGTHEFFRLKDQLVRALATDRPLMLLWESDFVPLLEARRILGDDQEPIGAALDALRGPLWNTEEIASLFTWIRAHHADEAGQPGVHLVGIDVFDLHGALAFACRELERAHAESGREMLELLSRVLGRDAAGLLSDETAFDAAFDGLDLEGMRRMAELCALLRDRLANRGGTKDGPTAARVAEQRVRHLLQFVNLLPDLGLERAGDVFGEYSAHLDGAGPDARMLRDFLDAYDPTHPASLDIVLAALGDPRRAKQAYLRSMTPADRQLWWEELLHCRTRLELRSRWLESSVGRPEIDDAQAAVARLLRWLDCVHELLRISPEREIVNRRELALADNVEAVLEGLDSRGRAVYWAHNFHVNRTIGPEGGVTSGSLLADRLGAELVSVGTFFGHGRFTARDLSRAPGSTSARYREFHVEDPPPDSLEYALMEHGAPAFALDLRKLPAEGPVAEWFRAPRRLRWIGNQYDPRRPLDFFFETSPAAQFDVLIFFVEANRSRPTASALERHSIEPRR